MIVSKKSTTHELIASEARLIFFKPACFILLNRISALFSPTVTENLPPCFNDRGSVTQTGNRYNRMVTITRFLIIEQRNKTVIGVLFAK